MNKGYDDYSFSTTTERDLLDEVYLMEINSTWEGDIPSNELNLEAIEAPIYAADAARRYGLDPELMNDTAGSTKLLLDYEGRKMMVRDTARTTLGETAKLFGSALGRMETPMMAETLNHGLAVARGKSLLLMRYGKISAVHSDADGGYQIMPISSLLEVAIRKVSDAFGTMDFRTGFNNHGLTTALWNLPDRQSDIVAAYRAALAGVSTNFSLDMMPAVRFMSSDTANSCASLVPVFILDGNEIQLVDGVAVKHSKRYSRDGKTGTEAFSSAAEELYAIFMASAEAVSRLASIRIYNGCNCVVSLCRRYNIPKKYGDASRSMVERFTLGDRPISAHDLYLCMYESVSEAKRSGAPWTQVLNLQESVARIAKADWSSHDVRGVVPWSN